MYYIDNVIPTNLGLDVDACSNNNEVPVNLNSGYTSGTGLTFQWYLNGGAITGEINPTYAAVASGSYSVTVNATAFCKGADTVDINVMNVPIFDLGLPQDVCQGDTVTLDMGPGGMIYQWYLNGLANSQDTFPTYIATQTAQYVGALITYSPNGHFCFSADTVDITAHPYPTPVLFSQTVCSNFLPSR